MSDELLSILRSDPAACDVHVALFVSAANSYKFDSVLIPFPPMVSCSLGNQCEKDIDSLVNEFLSLHTLNFQKGKQSIGDSSQIFNKI